MGRKQHRRNAVTGLKLCAVSLILGASIGAARAAADDIGPIHIGAAASLRVVWNDLIDQLPQDINSSDLRISFASTGLLQVQIQNGAPFDLFLAADRQSPAFLHDQGLTREPGTPYASGRLVLLARRSSELTLTEVVATIKAQFQRDGSARLAIANPRHAPYGRASRDWLEFHNVWPWPPDTLLLGENTAQALQFVQSGAVDYALLPSALVSNISDSFAVYELPEHEYELIDHHLVVLNHAPAKTDIMVQWLLSPAAQAVFASYGLDAIEP